MQPVTAVKTADLVYLYVETPLHAGAGPDEHGEVDLPIQRDEATGYPIIRASSLKGAFRGLAEGARPPDEVAAAFGSEPEPPDQAKLVGGLVFADARPLLFPVRSLVGVFAWVITPSVLARLQRDAAAYGLSAPTWPAIPSPPSGSAWIAPDSLVRSARGQVVLEEVTFRGESEPEVAALGRWLASNTLPADPVFGYWAARLPVGLVVLAEDAFRFFVVQSTEVAARIRIDRRTGAAAEGALWTEEYLPADTLLYAPLGANDPEKPAGAVSSAVDALAWLQALSPPHVQIGGGRTLGRGLVRLRWASRGTL